MEVVRHDDSGEEAADEGERPAVLEVDLDRLQPGVVPEVGDAGEVTVDGDHVTTEVEQEAGVAAPAAGQVEDRAGVGDQGSEPDHPGRGSAGSGDLLGRTVGHPFILADLDASPGTRHRSQSADDGCSAGCDN